MIRYLAAGVNHALGLHRPGRKLPVLSDDILLASYPHSGDTWLQFLIANLIHPDRTIDSSNLHRFIIDSEVTVKRDAASAPRPRLVNSHRSFDPRYRRIIYLVRDPRDVAVAQFQEQLQSTGGGLAIEDFIGYFLAGEFDRYSGSWGENAGSWLAACAHQPGFCVVRYEDLLADPAGELARLASFADWPETRERILQAIARSSSNHHRGAWENGLPEVQIERLERAWGDIASCLGYKMVTQPERQRLDPSLIGLLAASDSHFGKRLNPV